MRCGTELGSLAPGGYVGYLREGYGGAVHALHHRTAHLFGLVGGEYSADNVFVAVLIEHTARGILVHVLRGGHHLVEPHTVVAHLLGREQYLVLLYVTAKHRDLCHATHREQSRTYGPVGQCAELLHGGLIRGEAYDHHLAQDGRLRSERGLAHRGGKRLAHHSEFFRNNLTGEIDIGAPVEFDPHYRESRSGRRAHTAHIRCTVYGGLYRKCHQTLHLLGCHSVGFGHDDDRGGVQIGKYIHLHVERGVQATHKEQYGPNDDEQTVRQREFYNLVKHDGELLMVVGVSLGNRSRN